MVNDISNIIKHIGIFKGFDDGNLIFDSGNLTDEDFETIKHIKINTITGLIFDDRS